MADQHDYLALDWVGGEIRETLKQARQALELWVEGPADPAPMQLCQNCLHQVLGTLKMVEFHGAALLAEEMEQLAKVLYEGAVANRADAQEILMRAILQLPTYLERVQASRRDLPVVLLPLLNDLRAVRGDSLLSETSLFKPDLSAIGLAVRPLLAEDRAAFDALISKLRHLYQQALLGLLRSQDQAAKQQHLGPMMAVLVRLEQVSGSAAMTPLWEITAAVVEGLGDGGIALGSSIKLLLGQVDRVLRRLEQKGAACLDDLPPNELLKNLLYYAAKSSVVSPRIKAIRHRFSLQDALPSEQLIDAERARMNGPDQAAMHSVVTAISDELDKVKNALEQQVSKGHLDAEELAVQIAGLKQVGDTLAVLGFGRPCEMVRQQLQQLDLMSQQPDAFDKTALLEVAASLLGVESELEELVTASVGATRTAPLPSHLVKARAAVLHECLAALVVAKSGIVDFIASEWERRLLEPVPAQLKAVRGGLDVLQLPRPATLLSDCTRYISEQLLSSTATAPDWQSMDHLADAISAIEYYLERLPEHAKGGEELLLLAQQSVAALGYSSSGANADAADTDDASTADEQAATAGASGEVSGESVADVAASCVTEPPTDTTPAVLQDDTDMQAATDLLAVDFHEAVTLNSPLDPPAMDVTLPASREAATSLDAVTDRVVNAAAADVVSTGITAAETTGVADVPGAIEVEPADAEIIEIFAEEVDEVVAALNEYFPRWAADSADIEALAEFRRAFHTLKGSGRMVGATVVGELAWAVEDALNQVLDGNIGPSGDLFGLVRQIHGLIVPLVEDFAQQRPASIDTQPLIDALRQLTQGGSLATSPDVVALSADQDTTTEAGVTVVAPSADASDVVTEAGINARETSESLRDAAAAKLQSSEFNRQQIDTQDYSFLAATADEETETLQDIFVAEASSNLDELDRWLASLDRDFTTHRIDDLVHRCLHTLKGSARVTGINAMAELAEPAEKWVKEMINRGKPADDHMLLLIRQTHDLLVAAVDTLRAGQEVPEHLEGGAALIAGFAHFGEQFGGDGDNGISSQLLGVFLSEGMDIILDAEELLERWLAAPGKTVEIRSLSAELRLLADSSETAGLSEIQAMAACLADSYELLAATPEAVSQAFLRLAHSGQDALVNMMDCVAAGQTMPASTAIIVQLQEWCADIARQTAIDAAADTTMTVPADLAEEAVVEVSASTSSDSAQAEYLPDDGLGEVFLEEAEDLLARGQQALDSWIDTQASEPLAELQRYLHTLKGGARMAAVNHIADVAHELEFLYEALAQDLITTSSVLEALLQRAHDRLAVMADALHQGLPIYAATKLLAEMAAWRRPQTRDTQGDAGSVPVDGAITATADEALAAVADTESPTSPASAPAEWPVHDASEAASSAAFEAGVDGVNSTGNIDAVDTGAIATDPVATNNIATNNTANTTASASILDAVDSTASVASADVTSTHVTSEGCVTADDASVTSSDALNSGGPQDAPQGESGGDMEASPTAIEPLYQEKATAGAPTSRQRIRDVVRIDAEVLESLINLVGETSISRGRVEQGVGGFSNHIGEMGNTIERLYGQLRRLETETEAQILSNYKQDMESGQYDAEFDPLEMDRYSELHQITRQLSESVSDLLELKETLTNATRDTETLLLQQSRINTELQEQLMRTRMVPFSRMLPRLRRLVRQLSGELEKQVELDIINPEGELDRTMMERLVPPLEHLLRNAIDHGIEGSDARQAAGKPAAGRIGLELRRDGGDVLLILSDDGAGINTDAIRQKAVQQGLITAGTVAGEAEIQQLIFTPGFTTASAITQISGRGVGMDVVASDIKQLGGTVSVDSAIGRGTRFVVRLPFTLAINRALLVRAGEDTYAIPLTQVEGIARIAPTQLASLLAAEDGSFNYGGEDYRIDYLGRYVHGNAAPELEGSSTPLSLLLLKSRKQRVALTVDSLIGSREVVVKSVGPQLARVAGISGATILGDGSVVIILDMHTMLRTSIMQARRPLAAKTLATEQPAQPSKPLVMVTDDSVTVRKVMSRLLLRNGYEVVTAKDGVDAIARLEERRPDLMLLDIEMPRMDGYEVATLMRHDTRFIQVPIVMITSRTGDKHRQRAMDIGVDGYLGKPFQESDLLATLEELLTNKV